MRLKQQALVTRIAVMENNSRKAKDLVLYVILFYIKINP